MKAFILAAGLGTRLRPFTLDNPKALVSVGGVPMLQRVIERLKNEGFDDIVINEHHFADKIESFVREHDDFGVRIRFSDERTQLLDTGGAILHALPLLGESAEPFLIHNVDILSDAPLGELMKKHIGSCADATLLVSDRVSCRKLIFDEDCRLRGWHNESTGEYKPMSFTMDKHSRELAFSGIHIMNPESIEFEMRRQNREGAFSVIDFYLESASELNVKGYERDDMQLIDIGKPATLLQADRLFDK